MRQIMGPSILTGLALLLVSLAAGPWALYAGLALFGFGGLLLIAMLVWMLIGD